MRPGLRNTALGIYHLAFHCHCQINPNGLISYEPNKNFLGNIKQEEDFPLVTRKPLVGLRLPVSNSEGKVQSYKAFIEKSSQPRRQGAYKLSNTVLQQGAVYRIIKQKELG